jgi:hypothetical protein
VRSIFLIFFLLMASAATQDVGPKEVWSKTFGGPHGDGFWSLQKTRDGGYILTGYTSAQGQGSDLWLVKVDSDGGLLWDRAYGGSGEDVGYFVKETQDGGYVVIGSTGSYGMGEERLWILKTDIDGNKQWDCILGGFVSSLGDGGWSVDVTYDGGYIVTGYTRSFGTGKKDLWLVKTDSEGNLLWDKTFGGLEDDVGMSVVRVADGGYVVAGRTASFGAGGDDIWLLKVDDDGEEVWNTTFGGVRDEAAFQVIEQKDGFALVGRTESGSESRRIVLIKVDQEGRELWERNYSGSSGSSLQPTADGGLLIAGRKDSEDSGRDALLIKTDSSGWEQWSEEMVAEGDCIATSAILDSERYFVIAGISSPSRPCAEDAWLAKFAVVDEGTGRNMSYIEKIFKDRLRLGV